MIGMHVILETPGGTGLYLSFNVIGWIFAVLFIALSLWQITLNKKIYYSKFLGWALLGFCLLCLPLFYNNEFSDHAIPRILGLAGYILVWRKIPSRRVWAILGLITPLLLHSQLEFPFYASFSHWIIFVLLI